MVETSGGYGLAKAGTYHDCYKIPFGSLAISRPETHSFATRPHDRFAFIEELCLSSADELMCIKTNRSNSAASQILSLVFVGLLLLGAA